MLLKIFAIYDSKAECYYPPMFHATTGLAVRQFTELANSPETMVGKYPADYSLFEIGLFDNGNAQIKPAPHHKNLGKGLEYLNKEEELPLLNKLDLNGAENFGDVQKAIEEQGNA